MKVKLAVAIASLAMLAAPFARADWSLGASAEHFKWKETTQPAVKETGLRWALDLTWFQSREPGASAEYNLRFYAGNVDYNGAFLFTGTPASDETRYRGFTNELRLVYRMEQSPVDFVGGLGWDHWSRKFSSNQQEETWDIVYAKLGASYNATAKQGPLASAGLKYPVWTRENAHLTQLGFDSNPRLHPGRSLSFYGTLGYRFNPSWDVMAFYDSFRFKRSDVEFVSVGGVPAGGVLQPESRMDVIGLKVQHNF
jgi:hypothetical protein